MFCLSALIEGSESEFLHQFEESGIDIDEKTPEGQTLLQIAAENGHLSIVQYLVAHNAQLDLCDNNGWTALHCASFGGHIDVVLFLLSAGADCLVPTDDLNIPLHYFVRKASMSHPQFSQALAEILSATTDLINLPNQQKETW